MSIELNYSDFNRAQKSLFNSVQGQASNAINRSLTAIRKEFVEDLMTKTGLKRKIFNDRMPLFRASRDNLVGAIGLQYGKRIYMTDYPTEIVRNRQGKETIRLISPIYRKNTRTAFFSSDRKRIFIRLDNGDYASMLGRSVPRLFKTPDWIKGYQKTADDIYGQEIDKISPSVKL